MYVTERQQTNKWLDRPLLSAITIDWEMVLFTVLIVLAFVSRFYLLEPRVMSHDENSHVYYSWLLYRGQGYTHDPITHGPFQFHIVALSYFLFGDNDLTARIPAALFSIATIAFMWNYRRFLGRAGALAAGLMFLISPYMLYYGRYVRNEAFVAFFGVVTIWAILRYIESGASRYLFYLSAVTVLHFVTKETAFIYTAQAMIFLALYLVSQLAGKVWPRQEDRKLFLIVLLIAALLVTAGSGLLAAGGGGPAAPAGENAPPQGTTEAPAPTGLAGLHTVALVLFGLAMIAGLVAVFILVRGYSWQNLRKERSFDMLVVLGTLVLPMLGPFPAKLLGFDPIDYSNTQNVTVTAAFVIIFSLLAIAIGLLWNARLWLLNAALFYAIFTIFYTTVFTNGFGFYTGLVGSLGYWLAQQGVQRGSQPWYYYWLVQIPVYEFLPALGSLLAIALALFKKDAHPAQTFRAEEDAAAVELFPTAPVDTQQAPLSYLETGYETFAEEQTGTEHPLEDTVQPPTFALLSFWAVTSLLAYTVAGEKMPWLTVHITMPLILLSGWSLGYLIETFDWPALRLRRGWLVLILMPVFLLSFIAALGSLLGTTPPFQGSMLEQIRATTEFVTAFLTAVGSAAGLFILIRPWNTAQFNRLWLLGLFAFLALLTARAAFRAAYINYDDANELLVYAHSAPGVKEALSQIEEISLRTTNGLDLAVAYDDQTTYPYWWYLRNYTNHRFYGANPTRSLRDVPAILVGDSNYGKIEPVVGQAYYKFDYIRLWWPNQDYFGLTWDRIRDAFRNPQMRAALFQIWLNRDYKLYGEATGKDMSLSNWYPSARMRLYLRKDIVSQIWNYGTAPAPEELVADPYESNSLNLTADQVIGGLGTEPGQFQRPRGVVTAADGTIYVADTGNHRIQHLSRDGAVLQVWGSFADASAGEAPGGTFNEPWGIALGPDGAVFVADTWNHRIQKFSPEGQFLKSWGFFGQAETPYALWGPRDVAVDSQGRVLVTDTGNKRIVVFDEEGNFLSQFGNAGMGPGEFDEPVGIATGPDDRVYVADTWNQRVQVFVPGEDNTYQPDFSWDVSLWYGQSLDNKPYIAVSEDFVFVTEPEGYRVVQFTPRGDFIQYWGQYSLGTDGFGLAGAVAIDQEGGVWVTDAGNSRLMHFTPPPPPGPG